MAFITQEDEFDKVFGKEKTMTEKFLESLVEYLETRRMITPFSDIYECLKKNKPISTFACRHDVAADMTEILGEAGIPCLKVLAPKGKIGFITPSEDDEAVMDLQKELLKKLSRPMPVYSGKKLRSLIDGKTATEVLSLGGLSQTEAYYMRNLCKKESDVRAVGIDQMTDGSYKFSVFAEDAIRKGNKGLTLAQIYINAKMMTTGKYSDAIKTRIDRQIRFENLLKSDMDVGTLNNGRPVTIVGEDGEYIKINTEGLEYGFIEDDDGHSELAPETTISNVMPNYRMQLISYLNRLVNPQIAKDRHELSAAIKSPRISETNKEIKETMSEKAVLSKIADMIEGKKIYDPVMSQIGEYSEKFSHMVEDSRQLLIASVTKDYPNEYTEEEQKSFEEVMQKNDVSMFGYKPILSELRAAEIRIEKKDIERITDMNELQHEQTRSVPSRDELGL